jgi:serine phosphatase RsbU (regulator of sigma subunit)
MTYARAGHPYPILIKPKQQPQQLEIRGSLLGVFEQAEFVQGTIQLERGDKLLLYSDGAEPFVGNFDSAAGFRFTKEFLRIKNLLVVEMMDQFNTLAQTQKVDPAEVDDITMVALEIL